MWALLARVCYVLKLISSRQPEEVRTRILMILRLTVMTKHLITETHLLIR